jgi:hypothetical protein
MPHALNKCEPDTDQKSDAWQNINTTQNSKSALLTFIQENVPDTVKILDRHGSNKESREPIQGQKTWNPKMNLDTNKGFAIVPGVIPNVTYSFLNTAGSLASIALLSNAASTSNWMILAEKYGRRWASIIEVNIQKASSSGESKSKWPAMEVSPDNHTSYQQRHEASDNRDVPELYWISGTILRYACKSDAKGPSDGWS